MPSKSVGEDALVETGCGEAEGPRGIRRPIFEVSAGLAQISAGQSLVRSNKLDRMAARLPCRNRPPNCGVVSGSPGEVQE